MPGPLPSRRGPRARSWTPHPRRGAPVAPPAPGPSKGPVREPLPGPLREPLRGRCRAAEGRRGGRCVGPARFRERRGEFRQQRGDILVQALAVLDVADEGAKRVDAREDRVDDALRQGDLSLPEPLEDVLGGVRHVHHGLEAEESRRPLERMHAAEDVVQDLLVLAVRLELDEQGVDPVERLLRLGNEIGNDLLHVVGHVAPRCYQSFAKIFSIFSLRISAVNGFTT